MTDWSGLTLHPDLMLAKGLVYDPLSFVLSQPVAEAESKEYAACEFTVNTLQIKYRVAKTTPTKVGQFVTLWKRNEAGITCAHEASDPIDLYVISVRKNVQLGQFVFTREVLIAEGILATPKKDGKRGFRIYPPWETDLNKQALKTQSWQKKFFMEISEKPTDTERASVLYDLKLT